MKKNNVNIFDIQELLHDARLLSFKWKEYYSEINFTFDCLRRNLDLSKMSNCQVDIILLGVKKIAAYYNPSLAETPLSKAILLNPFSINDLETWSLPPSEALLCINSQHEAFNMHSSWKLDWLLNNSDDPGTAPPYYANLIFLLSKSGHGINERSLYFEFDSIHILSNGAPLSIDEWGKQYEAWWKNWEEYWHKEYSSRFQADNLQIEEDKFTPLVIDPGLDFNYRPPTQPPFQVQKTNIPDELIHPIREFTEGHHNQEWHRMAQVWPNFDKTLKEQMNYFEQQYLFDEFGSWIYIRSIENWWQEDAQASITVKGFEHWMPDEDSPATDKQTVITYSLRKHHNKWIIWNYSQL